LSHPVDTSFWPWWCCAVRHQWAEHSCWCWDDVEMMNSLMSLWWYQRHATTTPARRRPLVTCISYLWGMHRQMQQLADFTTHDNELMQWTEVIDRRAMWRTWSQRERLNDSTTDVSTCRHYTHNTVLHTGVYNTQVCTTHRCVQQMYTQLCNTYTHKEPTWHDTKCYLVNHCSHWHKVCSEIQFAT